MNEYNRIAVDAMETIWSKRPRGYQNIIIPHLIRMMSYDVPPEPVLLVQSTGSGKLLVPLTCAVVDGGVTIVIENTLALGSDQACKVNDKGDTGRKYIKAIQLDMIKSDDDEVAMSEAILTHCNTNKDSSIVLFTYPERRHYWGDVCGQSHCGWYFP